jgi:hypothetical protein
MNNLLIVQAGVYGFALWFGCYVMARSGGKSGLISAGLGLLAYAFGVAFASISRYIPALDEALAPRYLLLTVMPAVYWFGTAYSLLPDMDRRDTVLRPFMTTGPLTIIGLGVLLVSDSVAWVRVLAPIVFLLTALWCIWQAFRQPIPHTALKIFLTATLFFIIGCFLLILPQEVVSNELALLAVGGDLLLLGYSVSKLNAYEEGTALLPDMLPSLSRATIAAGAVGTQFMIFMALSESLNAATVVLFYTTLGTVIAFATWQGALQRLMDQFLFGQSTRLTQERETLISVADALPRQDTSLDVLTLDETEFTRLTRRALSHYNDLSKLVASPLIQLPIISEQLREKGKIDTSLERAHELRSLLEDHILQLRPVTDKDFDTGDDWRYYNALYFPYVLELKPYNVKPLPAPVDTLTQQALDWFQTYVPERTLYNWQTSAAKLIARQLRETIKMKNGAI